MSRRLAPPRRAAGAGPRRAAAAGPRRRARDALLLLRPAQWPILTCQLAVGALACPAAAAALRGGPGLPSSTWLPLAAAWAAWVVGLNGGTLAFNSAFDRDTEAVAFLRRPPPPPPGLAGFALALMLGGAVLAAIVSRALGALTAGCLVLSLLYSHPATRWKGVPGADLAVNMAGYGAGTTLAGLLAAGRAFAGGAGTAGAAGGAGPSGMAGMPDPAGWLLAAGFGLLFGSLYPLTQLYQRRADLARGDRTLATALGPARSLDLSLALGMAAAAALLRAVAWRGAGGWRLAAAGAALAAWLLAVAVWRGRAAMLEDRQHERRMYVALALWAAIDVAVVLALLGGAPRP